MTEGDEVRITEGPMASCQGKVIATEGDRVRVEVILFGRRTAVVVSANHVEVVGRHDPRSALRRMITAQHGKCMSMHTVKWQATQHGEPEDDLANEGNRARAYGRKMGKAYPIDEILGEFDAVFADAPDDAIDDLWERHRPRWFAMLEPPTVTDEEHLAAQERLKKVAAAEDAAGVVAKWSEEDS